MTSLNKPPAIKTTFTTLATLLGMYLSSPTPTSAQYLHKAFKVQPNIIEKVEKNNKTILETLNSDQKRILESIGSLRIGTLEIPLSELSEQDKVALIKSLESQISSYESLLADIDVSKDLKKYTETKDIIDSFRKDLKILNSGQKSTLASKPLTFDISITRIRINDLSILTIHADNFDYGNLFKIVLNKVPKNAKIFPEHQNLLNLTLK